MNTLIIIFIGSICLLVAQKILRLRFSKNWFLSLIKGISFVAIIFSGFLWIILNANVFKDSNGWTAACVFVVALPWIIDNLLGTEKAGDKPSENVAL